MRLLPSTSARRLGLRLIAAGPGGYGLATLFSLAALALPLPTLAAARIGMLGSFAVFAAAVIGVFAARDVRRAWAGLALAALPLALGAWHGTHG